MQFSSDLDRLSLPPTDLPSSEPVKSHLLFFVAQQQYIGFACTAETFDEGGG